MDGHLRARQPDSQAGTQAVSIHLRLAGQMDAMLLGPEWKSELCEEVFFSSVTRSPNLALEFIVRLAAFASPVELKIIEADMVEVDAREQL